MLFAEMACSICLHATHNFDLTIRRQNEIYDE